MEITDFLNSAQDYLQGIALVKKYCPNKTDLIKRFEKCESNYNREKIAFLLGKVSPLQTLNEAINQQISEKQPNREDLRNVEGLPDEIAKAIKLRNDALRESDFLFAQLPFLASDDERFQRQERMMELEEIADFNDTIVKHWDTTKEILTTPIIEKVVEDSELPTDKLELHKKLTNNRSYVSKAKNQQNNPQEVAKRKLEIEEIEKILAQN
jgi:hypothetical protein